MAIDKLGFLSPELQGWIQKHRRENSAWFDLAEKLNILGQNIITHMVVPDEHQRFLGALLFLRGMSNFQGALLLVEKGMTVEARILARSVFETLFFLGALKNKPEFVGDLISDDASRRKKLAKNLKRIPEDLSGLSAAHVEKIDAFLLELYEQTDIEIKGILIREAAKIAGAEADYDTLYSGLSNDSAHPSIVSLNRHIESNDMGHVTGLRWGPNVKDVEDTVFTICAGGFQLILKAAEILGIDIDQSEIDQCKQSYEKLVKERTEKIDAEFNQIIAGGDKLSDLQ